MGDMSSSTPAMALLLDVDGPIANPGTRKVSAGIIASLRAIAVAGWPVIFNTGRSDSFIREQIMVPLLTAGLPENVKFYAICEKGATWFSFTANGEGPLSIDQELKMPETLSNAVRELVEHKYESHMFFDETKRAMISVEQRIDVSNVGYRAEQETFDAEVLSLMRHYDYGVSRLDHHVPGSDDTVDYRIDPNIIATDIESVRVGKDLGACRAVELLAHDGILPQEWRTVGDSRTDYAMADWLHHNGHPVTHVDVRPAEGIPEKAYRILTAGELINDDAGAVYLRRWTEMTAGTAKNDDDVL